MYQTSAKFRDEEYKKKVNTSHWRVRVAEVEGDLEPARAGMYSVI